MRGLTGKVAIVTGATKDMGMAVAERLGDEGVKVICCGRDSESGEQCAAGIRAKGGEAEFFRVDVGVEEDVKSVVSAAVERFGRLDIVVNVAALVGAVSEGRARRVTEETNEGFLDHIRINVMAPFWFFKYGITEMLKTDGGNFVHISSLASRMAIRQQMSYTTSKAALEGMSRQVALDYGANNIRSNCIVVGVIRNAKYGSIHDHPEAGRAMLEVQIVQRSGVGGDVASMTAFLASDESSFITGAALPVEGGALIKFMMPDRGKYLSEA
jgi:NAD(P)-dependent dehydrogenase (short-subunit alcohol dehydrogenase family)